MSTENANPEHEQYMRLALDLARRGIGTVEPNPAVGCVIVQANHIIGKGWHEKFGGPHAEINALSDCWKHGYNPAGSTIYVTLEPCKHFGKTPPCTEAVVMAGIKKVVYAAPDPYEISGGGAEQLRQAGVQIITGVCRQEAEALNAPFFKHARTGLPWVVLKWAQSLDGKLAWKNPPPEGNWISNEQSRRDVHLLRKRAQGILTGIDTVLSDNPRLTVRLDNEPVIRPPVRIILDSHLRMPWDSHLITIPEAPTIIVTTVQTAQTEFAQVERLKSAGVEILTVSETDNRCDLPETLTLLGQRSFGHLLVEAGPTLLTEFLRLNLADEVRIYIAPMILGSGGAADLSAKISALLDRKTLRNVELTPFGDNIRLSALI
jgi:diaminohydroxyphosphoribosylaminopyrimidine deaminase/5-amino-6-(5-phosphoribosylamino)uracil reductase